MLDAWTGVLGFSGQIFFDFAGYSTCAIGLALCLGFSLPDTLDDTMDLWAEQRAAVKPDSLVIIGDSRPLFDIDLDALEAGLGKRPVQLSIAGSSCYPILQDLAADESFRGDLIISLVPIMYFTPGSPLIASSEDALKHRATRSPSQRFGNHVFMFFDQWLAFINQDDLNLKNLLLDVAIADRPGALVPPRMPPLFFSLTADRRARMVDECARDGSALQAAAGEALLRVSRKWKAAVGTAAGPPPERPAWRRLRSGHRARRQREEQTDPQVGGWRRRRSDAAGKRIVPRRDRFVARLD